MMFENGSYYIKTQYMKANISKELELCLWLSLTGDLEWDPHSSSFAEYECNMVEEIMSVERRERKIYGSI